MTFLSFLKATCSFDEIKRVKNARLVSNAIYLLKIDAEDFEVSQDTENSSSHYTDDDD